MLFASLRGDHFLRSHSASAQSRSSDSAGHTGVGGIAAWRGRSSISKSPRGINEIISADLLLGLSLVASLSMYEFS
jgi:hypothetical protein